MAAMASLLKVSSLVVNRDSKPSLSHLKWRNPPLLRTTQISLPSSMIKNTTTTAGGFIRTIKCRSDFRVQCVMNSKNKNCFKKEEKEVPFERFGKLMLKVLKALEKSADAVILGWIFLTKNPAIFLGVWLAYDLCKAIWAISSQYSRLRNGENIQISMGSVLSLVMFFLCSFAAVFGFGTVTSPPRSKEGSVNTDTQRSTRLKKLSKLLCDKNNLCSEINVHEENLRIMESQLDKLDESILDMQGNLQLKGLLDKIPSDLALTKDVLGIVATLGKVDDDNLSRLFSEYLGLETMMALVCKTSEGANSLETYHKEGNISPSAGLHGFGPSIGRPIDGRFLVICLESLRPYVGDFVAEDPQRRLALLKPRLPSGECPPGFLGFAVNMINLDKLNLHYVTSNGNGLRETLFYSLFSHLQVYRTRAEMHLALPCISDGAVSLDGGMIRSPGVFSLGNRKDVEVRFTIGSGTPNPPVDYENVKEKIKIMKSDKKRLLEDMQREQTLLNDAKHNSKSKLQEFNSFLVEMLAVESVTSSGRS